MTETNDCEGATSVSQRATMLGATTKLEAALWLVAAPARGARKKEAWELNLARWSEDLTLRLRSCLPLPQRAQPCLPLIFLLLDHGPMRLRISSIPRYFSHTKPPFDYLFSILPLSRHYPSISSS